MTTKRHGVKASCPKPLYLCGVDNGHAAVLALPRALLLTHGARLVDVDDHVVRETVRCVGQFAFCQFRVVRVGVISVGGTPCRMTSIGQLGFNEGSTCLAGD